MRPGEVLSAVARRYGIAARILFRWKQELAAVPTFVTVEITEGELIRVCGNADLCAESPEKHCSGRYSGIGRGQ